VETNKKTVIVVTNLMHNTPVSDADAPTSGIDLGHGQYTTKEEAGSVRVQRPHGEGSRRRTPPAAVATALLPL
jgi:hypothetical protein